MNFQLHATVWSVPYHEFAYVDRGKLHVAIFANVMPVHHAKIREPRAAMNWLKKINKNKRNHARHISYEYEA